MRRAAELAVFLGLAGGLHLAALSQVAGGGGVTGGDGGRAEVTLEAAPESLAALAEAWDAAPPVAEAPALTAPSPEGAAMPPAELTAPRVPAAPARPDAAMVPDAAPVLDMRPPAPASLGAEAPSPLQAPAATDGRAVPETATDPAPLRQNPTRPEAPDAAAPPEIDTRLPALRDVQREASLAPEPPAVPDAPSLDRSAPSSVLRQDRPALAAPPPEPLPEVNPFADASGLAPTRSVRPARRPDADFAERAAAAARAAAAQPSVARPAQRAQGQGQAPTQSATRAPAAPAGPSAAALRRAEAEWGAQIRNRVARAQRYPRGTSATGTVTLRLSVNRSGRLAGVSVVGSSGHRVLDQAALRAAEAARLPAAPAALRNASYAFNLPLRFARR